MANCHSLKSNFNTSVLTPKLDEWFVSKDSLCWPYILVVEHLPTVYEVLGWMAALQKQKEENTVVTTSRWKTVSYREIKSTTIVKDASTHLFSLPFGEAPISI